MIARAKPEGVERVFTGAQAGGYHGNHACFALVSNEGVAQHLGELGGPEGEMGAPLAKGTDAFLQGEQRLVDLSTFHS